MARQPTSAARRRPGARSGIDLLYGAAFLVAMALGEASADIIVLSNGNEIQGEIVGETPRHLTVRFPGGTLQLERKRVKEIRRQSRKQYLVDEAEKALRRRSYPQAIDLFSEALREDPEGARATSGLRRARIEYVSYLRELRRHDEALEYCRTLGSEYRSDPRLREEEEVLLEIRAQANEEEKRARLEIAEGDLETAVWRLRRLHENFPDRRESIARPLAGALVRQARALEAGGRWEEASERYLTALEVTPEALEALEPAYVRCQAARIRALIEDGSYEEAEQLARAGLEVAPSNHELQFFLGLSLDAAGRGEEAARAYASLLGPGAPAPTANALAKLRELAETAISGHSTAAERRKVLPGGFRRLESRRFVVHHRNAMVGEAVQAAAERAYEEIFQLVGPSTHWRRPCQIFVHPKKEDYLRVVPRISWSGGAHRVLHSLGSLSEHRIDSFQEEPRLTSGVIQHEVAHALLAHRLNSPTTIPLWANEGFAVRVEPAFVHRHYRRIVAGELSRKRLISIERLLSLGDYPADEAMDLFYGQSYLLVEFLVARRGVETFLAFLRDICRGGVPVEKAIAKHYRIPTVLALENRWIGWLRG